MNGPPRRGNVGFWLLAVVLCLAAGGLIVGLMRREAHGIAENGAELPVGAAAASLEPAALPPIDPEGEGEAGTAGIETVPFEEPAPPVGSVAGQVVDARGEPIADAEVCAVESLSTEKVILRARTREGGLFVLEPLPLGRALRVQSRTPGRVAGDQYVSLRVDKPTDTVHLRLWDAATLRGRVVDAASGQPVVGADVCADDDGSRQFGFEPQAEGVSDHEGRFSLPGVPLGVVKLHAAAAGYEMVTEVVRVTADREVNLKLTSGVGVTMTVTVAGLDAIGLEKALIRVIAYDSGSARSLPSSLLRGGLDEEGKWQRMGLPDHEYLVTPSAEGWTFQPRKHRVKAGSLLHDLEFRAVRDGEVTIRGRLRHESGRALPHELILCRASNGGRRSTARTADDGTFEMDAPLAPLEKCVFYLVNSRYVLHQEKDQSDSHSMDMRARARHDGIVDSANFVDLRAIGESRVVGRVIDHEGRAVAGAPVVLEHANQNRRPRWMRFAWSSTDQDGNFVFEGLHAVEDDIRVAVAVSAGSGFSPTIKLVEGADTSGVVVLLGMAGTVEGVVSDERGLPVPGARVWLEGRNEESRSAHQGNINEVLADRDGRYRFLGVGPGEFAVSAFLDRQRSRRNQEPAAPLRVTPGQYVRHDVVVH